VCEVMSFYVLLKSWLTDWRSRTSAGSEFQMDGTSSDKERRRSMSVFVPGSTSVGVKMTAVFMSVSGSAACFIDRLSSVNSEVLQEAGPSWQLSTTLLTPVSTK